jgi:hypothetical protein
MKHSKNLKKHSKKYKKRSNQSKKIQKGGVTCQDETVSCNTLDTNYSSNKVNQVWKTCIRMNGIYNHIIYLTELNVIIKDIETTQIPHFYIKIPETPEYKGRSKILIEDKFIGCFLKICGEWYAMMRLFGKTLNTGILARTETNKVFYKIKNIKFDLNDIEKDSGIIEISRKFFTEKKDTYLLSTSTTPILLLNPDCYEVITTKQIVFNVLQRFRQEKLIANSMKKVAAKTLFHFIFGLFQN